MYRDLIVITDRKLCQNSLVEQIRKLVLLSPRAVILREKDLPDEEYFDLARNINEICLEKNVDFYIHSRLEIARELGVRNIHLTIPAILKMQANEMNMTNEESNSNASNNLHEDKYWSNISVSCHSRDDIEIAKKAGANQIILGTIFETQCKPGKKGAGLDFVRDMTALTSIPVYGIGGIKPEHILALKEAGAAGGCMMSEFMKL